MAVFSSISTLPTPPPPQEKPITIEGISEFWFLILALVSIVAYLVRLEMGVMANRDRLRKIEDETLPAFNKDLDSIETNLESRLQEARAVFAVELKTALESQKDFIQSRFDVLLEKLSTRDSAIAALKEQSDRQGQELREMNGYRKYLERHNSTD